MRLLTRPRKCRASYQILSRPAEVYIGNWVDGRKIAFEVSAVSPTQDAILHGAAAAIKMRKMAKNCAHLNNCHAQGIIFQPFVVETFGGWDQEAVK